jgi:hypothetical protein
MLVRHGRGRSSLRSCMEVGGVRWLPRSSSGGIYQGRSVAIPVRPGRTAMRRPCRNPSGERSHFTNRLLGSRCRPTLIYEYTSADNHRLAPIKRPILDDGAAPPSDRLTGVCFLAT